MDKLDWVREFEEDRKILGKSLVKGANRRSDVRADLLYIFFTIFFFIYFIQRTSKIFLVRFSIYSCFNNIRTSDILYDKSQFFLLRTFYITDRHLNLLFLLNLYNIESSSYCVLYGISYYITDLQD